MPTLFAFLFGTLAFSPSTGSLSYEWKKIYGIADCKIIRGTKTKNNRLIYSTYSEYFFDEQGREKR